VLVDPAVLRAAASEAGRLAEELPRLGDQMSAAARQVVDSAPGFATTEVLVATAESWQGRLAGIGSAFARAAEALAATADRDVAADGQSAGSFEAVLAALPR
jgi:hypothetical protein